MPWIGRTDWTAPKDPTQRTGSLRVTVNEINEADKDMILKALRSLIESIAPPPGRLGGDKRPREEKAP